MPSDVRAIAFYLPQFHPIPENDAWWGRGFTEWRPVASARPLFRGHRQPHLPADLGFYDLRVAQTRFEQAELAREHGLAGFCYYWYWFSGKRLLERPLDEVLASQQPDFPFCVCWANENWTRRWDGRDDELLARQRYAPEDPQALVRAWLPMFEDRRYMRVSGRPLVLVYCADALPEPVRWTEIWRQEARRAGHPDLYLAHVLSVNQRTADPAALGFDAAVEFPPHWMRSTLLTEAALDLVDGFRGAILDYVACARSALGRPEPDFPMLRGVMPGWDNTARAGAAANIFVNAEPANYERWLKGIVDWTRARRQGDERIVFINAWNEWAEGCHLEPDLRYGRAFLEATQRALA
jgi:lipopolysaccharide biosynthesis protein